MSEAQCDCIGFCNLEAEHSGLNSPGKVEHGESLIRLVLNMHIKKPGKVEKSFIRSRDLLNGELSVWRKSQFQDHYVSNTYGECIPSNENVVAIAEATAEQVRQIKLAETNSRAFCIIDDTRTGSNSHHIAHCTIAICKSVNKNWDNSNPNFIELRNKLHGLFCRNKKDVA